MARAILATLALLGLGTGVHAGESDALRERAEAILADGYQRELPVGQREVAEPRGCGSPATARTSSPAAPAGVLVEILLYALLGAMVLGVLLGLGREVARRGRGEASPDDAVARDAPAGPPPPPMDEAEDLAAAGRFDAAARLLLQRVLAWVVRREGQALPDSLTSREVLASTSLRGERRAALEALVGAVERSLFGGRPVGRAEWDHCLAAYRRLDETMGGA